MKMSISNIDNVFNKLSNGLKVESRKNLETQTNKLVKALKEATPVDTGAARDSWHVEKTYNGLNIKNDVEYIDRLNRGSSKQAPANFVETTALNYGTPQGSIVESS